MEDEKEAETPKWVSIVTGLIQGTRMSTKMLHQKEPEKGAED